MTRLLLLAGLLAVLSGCATAPIGDPVDAQVLLRTSHAWNGSPYSGYPATQPELTVLKIRIAPDTTLDWHRHPAPNAGYLSKGELLVETRDGQQVRLRAGEALAEVVDVVHRGRSGSQGAELIVFYAGSPGLPLSMSESAHTDQPPASANVLSRLLDTLERRLDIAEAVAWHKWDSGQPVEAVDRERQVIANAREQANGYGLSAQRVADVLADQIEANKLLQYGALSAWHAEGRGPVGQSPSLHTQLRPQLDRLQDELLAHLAAFDQQPPPRCEKALAQDLQRRNGDPHRTLALIRASGRLCEAR